MRRAFTLIELLVVIAVIALLLGILLPSLRSVRETGWATVCTSNMRQLSTAANLYANDWRDEIWPQFDWAPLPYNLSNTGPQVGKGLLYEYVDSADTINECPKHKRRSARGTEQRNAFGGTTGLNFDYTMVGRVQGLRVGTSIRAAYLTDPRGRPVKPPISMPQSNLTLFSGIPLFVEESLYFYNDGITDGLWGNLDQISQRHFGGGTVAFVEGHAEQFRPPRQGTERESRRGDLTANDLYVSGRGRWVRLEPTNDDNRTNWRERPYGWVNNPQ